MKKIIISILVIILTFLFISEISNARQLRGQGISRTAVVQFCTVTGDKNTTSTVSGDIVYCDKQLKMWTPTAIPGSTRINKTWGPLTETVGTCDNRGATYPACNYCDTLTYAGYSDWVLPSCDGSGAGTNCQLYVFGMDNCGWSSTCGLGGNCSSCSPIWDTNATIHYWSNGGSNDTYAYRVGFDDGCTDIDQKGNTNYIRCVR